MRRKSKWKGLLALLLATSMVLPSMTVVAKAAVDESETALYQDEGKKREQINFNRGWKFLRSDKEGAQNAAFDDSEWVNIGLPHNFSIPYEMSSKFYVGYGWYRKEFDYSSAWTDKKVELEFEGVFQVAEVYVNGTLVGTHEGGYSGFVYDITDELQEGKNLIAVRVNNIWQPDLAPRAGDHQFTGGIYRDVNLNVTDPVHVTWYGTYVTTPDLCNPGFDASAQNVLDSYTSEAEIRENLKAKRSNVKVETEVKNDDTTAKKVKVKQTVVDKEENVVAEFESSEKSLAAGEIYNFEAVSQQIKNIELWSEDNPYIYQVYTTVYSDGQPVDSYESPLGFRWAQYRNDGFYLNGEKVLLNGANAHQDHAGFADAVSNEGFARDVAMIKECGMNFIRGSHYPHDPSYAKACDELGVMFWSECNFWGMGGCAGKDDPATMTAADWFKDAYPQNPDDEAAFEQSCMDSLEAMIRVNRNHPSVINWSMGNEVFFTSGGMENSGGTSKQAKELVNKMRNRSHELDPSRKAGMGGVQRGNYDQLEVCDIAGYNGDGGKMTNTWMPNLVAEYASTTSDRPGSYRGYFGDIEKPGDPNSFELKQNSAGLSLWCAFHHGTIGGDGLAKMGFIDYYRLPLNTWYWYRKQYTGVEPEASVNGTATQMEITASQTEIKNDGTDDTKLIVTMQNEDGAWVNDTRKVTLTVESGPGIFPGGKEYVFVPNKSIRDGKASIEFRSYYSGDTVISAEAEGVEKATITIHTNNTTGEVEGEEPDDFYTTNNSGNVTEKIEEPYYYGGQNVASGRPIFPSSNDADRALAADGKLDTSWVSEKTGSGAYWMLDLEFTQYLYKVKLGFDKAPYPYKLEVAMDKQNGPWTTVAEYSKDTIVRRLTEESLEGIEARYVKVTFTDVPKDKQAFLSECEVYGNASSQASQYTTESVYLSDVVDFSTITTGWKEPGKDLSCEGAPISVGGKTYEKGIGVHADSQITHRLDKQYTRFTAVAGIDDEVSAGNAIFRVYADNKLIYEKELSSGESDFVNLSVNGVTELRLLTDANENDSQDHTDWADAKLYGAIRDISKKQSGFETHFIGMPQSLQAGEKYLANIDIANKESADNDYSAILGLYDAKGKLVDYTMLSSTLTQGKKDNKSLSTLMPEDITGYEARMTLVDTNSLKPISKTTYITRNMEKETAPSATEMQWNKVDGELMSKVGNWKMWPGSDAYEGTETYTGDKDTPLTEDVSISYTFTGSQVRVGAKIDGSQVGAEVYIDGTKVGTIDTKAYDTTNAYQQVWQSELLQAGEHTIKLVPTGKFGIDYVEYGVQQTISNSSEDKVVLLNALDSIMKKVETESILDYKEESRTLVAQKLMDAYAIYTKQDASKAEIEQMAAELVLAESQLELIDRELEAARAELTKVIAKAKPIFDGGQNQYTDESWKNFTSAFNNAKEKDKNTQTTKEEIIKATKQLESAIKELKTKPNPPVRKPQWKHNKTGWWYEFANGTYPKNKWEKIEGKWYYFDLKGYMQIGWLKVSGQWYYLKSNGAMATGWVKDANKWYYMKANGAMVTGWVKDANKWYYMKANGVMSTGWVKDANKWYYMKANGVMATDWIKTGGKSYYLYNNGVMAKNTWIGKYYVNNSGVWTKTRK